jgi:hypothetical protein
MEWRREDSAERYRSSIGTHDLCESVTGCWTLARSGFHRTAFGLSDFQARSGPSEISLFDVGRIHKVHDAGGITAMKIEGTLVTPSQNGEAEWKLHSTGNVRV